ncbi:GNAT family N-acetyltransferase [Micromonospora sp. FIMYZ51]|uniref:GNAT family N-acetyltransferase n=1 Tax=Micromonospora sp. FIMYZ51 TaxID=3051832 RepID=UPI00311E7518
MGTGLLVRARRLWVELAGVPMIFPARGVAVAVSARSLLCPPDWVGIVALGDAAISTVPVDGFAQVVRKALDNLPVTAMTDPERLAALLPVEEVLGPATLAYCDEHGFRPYAKGMPPERLPGGHPDLADLLASVPTDEADECGLAEITSPAFVIRAGTRVVAAAGYRHWPGQVAHLSVLTAPDQRRRGLARVVASAAVAESLTNRMLPQWRARPEPSRRVARALGFRELGAQLSVRLGG